MSNGSLLNQLGSFNFVLGRLENQQKDPLCMRQMHLFCKFCRKKEVCIK